MTILAVQYIKCFILKLKIIILVCGNENFEKEENWRIIQCAAVRNIKTEYYFEIVLFGFLGVFLVNAVYFLSIAANKQFYMRINIALYAKSIPHCTFWFRWVMFLLFCFGLNNQNICSVRGIFEAKSNYRSILKGKI